MSKIVEADHATAAVFDSRPSNAALNALVSKVLVGERVQVGEICMIDDGIVTDEECAC